MLDVVRRTAEQVFIPLTVGGGIRTTDDVDPLLRAGADKVGINTAAIARPELLGEASRRFGSQCIVLSVDARRVPADGHADAVGLGGHHPRRAPRHRHRRRRVGRARPGARASGRSCSTRWTPTAPGPASTCEMIARGPGRGRRPGDRQRRRGRGGALRAGGARRAPTRCSRRACSTSASADRRGQGRAARRGGGGPVTRDAVTGAGPGDRGPAQARRPTGWSAPSSSSSAPARC